MPCLASEGAPARVHGRAHQLEGCASLSRNQESDESARRRQQSSQLTRVEALQVARAEPLVGTFCRVRVKDYKGSRAAPEGAFLVRQLALCDRFLRAHCTATSLAEILARAQCADGQLRTATSAGHHGALPSLHHTTSPVLMAFDDAVELETHLGVYQPLANV